MGQTTTNTGQTGILQQLTPSNRFKLLGEIVALMLRSPLHAKFPIEDLQALILPPLDGNQFRVYYAQKDIPIAYVSWARLSDDVFQKYIIREYKTLLPKDWNSGSNLLITEFIAPFGHAKQVVKDLRQSIFPDEVATALRYYDIGKFRKTIKFRGKNIKLSAKGGSDDRSAI